MMFLVPTTAFYCVSLCRVYFITWAELELERHTEESKRTTGDGTMTILKGTS